MQSLRKYMLSFFSVFELKLQIYLNSVESNTNLESINLVTVNIPHHINTNKIISFANQLTVFYMIGKICR